MVDQIDERREGFDTKIVIVVAASENGVIGNDGDLPFRIKSDLKHFKSVTDGHTIIMGRKTWESLPGILPNRRHVVMTRNEDYDPLGARVVNSLEEAMELVSSLDKAIVIGGEEIYKLWLPYADQILLSRVHAVVEGDTFFRLPVERGWTLKWFQQREAAVGDQYRWTLLNVEKDKESR